MRLAVFSICPNQGVPQARLLLETVEKFLPAADRFLVLADQRDSAVPYPDGCDVIEAQDLGISDFAAFAFRYDLFEFSAALKPFAFLHFLGARGYTHCLYFDPDIEIFCSLSEVMEALQSNATFVLTPHILMPAERPEGTDDVTIMRWGIYNLGFLGASGTREARDLLGWWARWLRWYCRDDRPIGLFVDQKFMDLVPGLADTVRILRDPALNLAYWNLAQRCFVPDAPAGPEVDGRPLGFFHYAGFDPDFPDRLGEGSDLIQGETMPASWRLFLASYADRLHDAGHGTVPADRYAYGRFCSGVPIPTIARRMFRDDSEAWAGDPFENFEAWAHLPARGVAVGIGSAVPSLIMQWLQAREPALTPFALSNPDGASYVTRWWLDSGPDAVIDRRFAEPQALAAGRRPVSMGASYPLPDPSRADASVIAPSAAFEPSGVIAQAQIISLGLAYGRVEHCDLAEHSQAPITGRVTGFCLPPGQLFRALETVNARHASRAYRIFIPCTERLQGSSSWLAALADIDEIWAPTRFLQASLVLLTDRPVLHMPVAWRFAPNSLPELEPNHTGFARPCRPYILADDDGFPGGLAVRAAIRAYEKAFAVWPEATRPAFVVNGRHMAEWDDTLHAQVAASGALLAPPGTNIGILVAGAACLLALHQGEAIGLTVLRALAQTVPVIATDYGGCTDLLAPTTGFPVGFRLLPERDAGPAPRRVEADADHAAWELQDLFSHPDKARRRAEQGRQRLETLHAPAGVAAQQATRLGLVERIMARGTFAVRG